MSHRIPLVNAPIGETGVNFTPDKFPQWVAYIAGQLEGVESGTGGGFNPLITGYGRIVGADFFTTDLTAPRLPSSPALALEIPNATWLVEDRTLTIDEPSGFLLLSDIPANMVEKYGYVSVLEIEDSGGEFTLEILPQNWFDTRQPSLSEAGLACIGQVTSDADSVSAIDGAFADVIVPLWVLLRQILALGGTDDSSGQPAPTGDVSRTEFNLLKSQVEGLIAEIAALKDRLGLPTTGTIADLDTRLARDVARLEEMQSRDRATDSLLMDASVFTVGVGDGQDLGNGTFARDVHSGNTLINSETGEES